MTSPFSLPEETVDAAREDRSSQWLSSITKDLDRKVSEGMRGLEQVATSAIEPIKPFAQALQDGGLKVPTLEDLTPSWMVEEHAEKAQGLASNLQAGGVSVPSVADLTPGGGGAATASGRPEAMPSASGSPASGPPRGSGEIESYIRESAARRKIDPDVAVRVALSEGGLDDPVRQSEVVNNGAREQSYGPFQMYMNGGLGNAALQRGIDPRNPAQWRETIDFALDEAARGGWSPWHGAARVGIGNRQGIGTYTGPVPASPRPGAVPAEQTPVAQAQVSPDISQAALDDPNKWALCGPVAAVIAATRRGGKWTVAQAKQIAVEQNLWDPNLGMHGLESQATLLRRMGYDARTGAANQDMLARDAATGNTPIISTNKHYFILTGYDPKTGRFDTTTTGGVLRGGSQHLTLEEIGRIGNGIQGAAYFDNPTSRTPSVAASAPNAPTSAGQPPSPSSGTSAGGGPPAPPADASPLDDARATNAGAGARLVMKAQDDGTAPPPPGSYFPVDPRPAPTYDREGVDITNTLIKPGYPPAPVEPWPNISVAPDVMYRQPLDPNPEASTPDPSFLPGDGGTAPTPQYDPRDADSGPREATPGSVGAQPLQNPNDVKNPADFGAYSPPISEAAPVAPIPGPDLGPGGFPIVDQPASNGPWLSETKAPAAPEPDPNMGMGIDPVRGGVGAAVAPAARVYGQAIDEAHAEQDETEAAMNARMSEFARTARVPLDVVHRAFGVANAVLLATPQAGADTIDAALSAAGLGRDALGIDLPVVGRVGIADVVDLGPLSNIGVGRAGNQATSRVGNAIASRIPDAAGAIERGAGSAIQAGREAIGDAGRAISGGVQGAGRRINEGIAANAERTAAADARMGTQRAVAAPGVFGTATGIDQQGMVRGRVVPPDVADTLDFPIRIPGDPATIRAIEAAGGTVDERGVTLGVTRAQSPSAAGGIATRGGVFYEAIPEGGRSNYGHYPDDPNGVGGTQVLPRTETRFRSPLIIPDAPGSNEGFDDAMRQIGTGPNKAEIDAAFDEVGRLGDQLRDLDRGGTVRVTPREYNRIRDAYSEAQRHLEDLTEGAATGSNIDRAIREARASGPEGSAARAAALKDVVSRYGGTPDEVDELLKIRGADASESAWAIKENILAANARRQGYDGVVTVQKTGPDEALVSKHPDVVAAKATVDQLADEWDEVSREAYEAGERMKASRSPSEPYGSAEAGTAIRDLSRRQSSIENRQIEAEKVYMRALEKARQELPSGKITELMDPREARNPTPGAPHAAEQARVRYEDLQKEAFEAQRRLGIEDPETKRLWEEAERAYAEYEQHGGAYGAPYNPQPPGYTLRSDIPRRPDAGTTSANAAAGTIPAARSTDRLGAVNNVLSQGVASAVSGGVGAATADQLGDPNDPNRQINGFAAGALVPQLATRGIRAGLKASGRAAEGAEGALATFGPTPNWTRGRPTGPAWGEPRGGWIGSWTPEETAEVTEAARRVSEMKPTPRISEVRRGGLDPKQVAEGIKEAAERGKVAMDDGTDLPTPPPNAPPTWYEWANAWRYSVGLFGNVSTALMQAGGGVAEVGLGAPSELIRHALIRGRPESIPLIIGEAIKSIPAGIASGLRTAGGEVPETILKSSDYRPSLTERTTGASKAAAFAIESPGRIATQAPDALWYEIFYRTGIAQAAAEVAQKETSRFNPIASIRRQYELIDNPTEEVIARAHEFAQDSTYKGELGAVAKAPEKLMRSGPTAYREAMSFLMPVYHTIARIHEGALEYTPGVGMLPLDELGLAAKGRPLDQRIGQQVVGLALTGAALSYAASGNIRGPGPSNQNDLKMLRDQGYEPDTTKVGGVWVPNSYFGRFGPILNAIGSYNDAVVYGEGDEKYADARWDRKMAMVSSNFGRAFQDYPFADAASTLIKAMDDPAGALAEFAGSSASQYVPAALRTYQGANDPLVRSPDRGKDIPPEQRFSDTFLQRSGLGRPSPLKQAAEGAGLPVPGDLPAAQDRFGRDRENPRQGWGVLLPRVGADKPDPVEQLFIDSGVSIGDPKKDLGLPVSKDETLQIPLTQREQDAWNRYRGELLLRQATAYSESPAFRSAPLSVREKELERIKGVASRGADESIKADIGADELRRRVGEGMKRRAGKAS